jgi:transcription antitermination protein NusB
MKFSAQARTRARRYCMQALYQWDLSGLDMTEIQRQFFEAEDFTNADGGYFIELLNGVKTHIERIDSHISETIDRPIGQLDPVERAILRIACYELLFRHDIPYRVSINEAIMLARKFGAEQGHAFINGVLDNMSRKIRPAESTGVDKQVTGS